MYTSHVIIPVIFRRKALYLWKQRNGSKATYGKLMKMFEEIGCRGSADKVRRIAQLSNSEGDDSSGSEEETKQPQTYPSYTPLPVLSQLPPAASKSAEIHYVVKDGEDLSQGYKWLNFSSSNLYAV